MLTFCGKTDPYIHERMQNSGETFLLPRKGTPGTLSRGNDGVQATPLQILSESGKGACIRKNRIGLLVYFLMFLNGFD